MCFSERRVNVMVFICLAVIFLVVGEIFLLIMYRYGGKQFTKYDKDNSGLSYESMEDFVSRVKGISGVEARYKDGSDNGIELIYKKNKYVLGYENNKIFVDYVASKCTTNVFWLSGTFRAFSFSKVVKKAYLINSVLENISEKDVLCTREYKKFKNCVMGTIVSVIIMIALALIGVFSFFSGTKDEAISNVKEIEFNNDMTYGEIIEGYIANPEWTAFNSENDTVVVEVTGKSVEMQQICIQFLGEAGMGFGEVDKQEFDLAYFEVGGKSVEPELAMEYIAEVVELGIDSWNEKINTNEDTTLEEGDKDVESEVDGTKEPEPTAEPTKEPEEVVTEEPILNDEKDEMENGESIEDLTKIDTGKKLITEYLYYPYSGFYVGKNWNLDVDTSQYYNKYIGDMVGHVSFVYKNDQETTPYNCDAYIIRDQETIVKGIGCFSTILMFKDEGKINYLGFIETDGRMELVWFTDKGIIDSFIIRYHYDC